MELFEATIGSRRNSSNIGSRRNSATIDTLLNLPAKENVPHPHHVKEAVSEHEEAYVSLALQMDLKSPDSSKVEIFHHGQYLGIK